MKSFRRSAFCALLAFAGVLAAAPVNAWQRDYSAVEIAVTEIRGGVYMLQGAGGNIGLSTGDDGAFVIDDQFAPLTDKILAAIAELTDKEVEFVLNTHHHGDHTGGNENFGEAGALIVAHDNVRGRLKERMDQAGGAGAAGLPVITFSDRATFYRNGHEIAVYHPKNAHTDGDAIVHFRDINVIHMGDVMFSGRFPYIDLRSGGSLNGYIKALEGALALCDDETKIIPGHGPLSDKADLEASIATLKTVRSRVQAMIDAGVDEEAVVAAAPLADFADTWGSGFINADAMTRTAYKSLRATD